MRRISPLAVGLALVWLCGLWGIRFLLPLLSAARGGDIMMGDIVDTPLIVAGLERAPHFVDTLKWWTGPWVGYAGSGQENSFYRPATSLLWWIEFQLFGRQGLAGFMAVHAALHLAVCALSFLFFSRLFSVRIACIAVCLWALNLALGLFDLPAPFYALEFWKDDPDLTVSLCLLGMCWAFWAYLREGKRARLGLSLGLFLLGLGFKELAYVAPFLVLLILWHERRLFSQWRAALPFWGLAVASFGFRTWALQGGGFRFGSNGSWLQRFAMECFGGGPSAPLLMGDGLPLMLSLVALALWNARNRCRCAFLLLLALGALGWTEWQFATTRGETLLRLLLPFGTHSFLPRVGQTFGLLALWIFFWRHKSSLEGRIQRFALGWWLIGYLPLLTAPILQHALYFMSLGWALWLAVPLDWVLRGGLGPLKLRGHERNQRAHSFV